MKVLVVDDSSTMRSIFVDVLTASGENEVVEAEHGSDGLQKMQEGTVDLIITDWNMPEMDGICFVREVRANPAWKDLPILMITTNSESAELVEAVRAGVTDFIVKPFHPGTLKARIEAALHGK